MTLSSVLQMVLTEKFWLKVINKRTDFCLLFSVIFSPLSFLSAVAPAIVMYVYFFTETGETIPVCTSYRGYPLICCKKEKNK